VPELTTIAEVPLPSGDEINIVRRRFGSGEGKRVAVVAGIRGDAPEGIDVAHRVGRFLAQVEDALEGTVDLYPCVNPLAAERGTRRWPFFDLDLNRRFPGRPDGHPPDRVAHALVADIAGADLVIELRGARPAFREATQAHVRVRDGDAARLAGHTNVAVVWCRRPGPASPATFAHQFPGCIVLEGGVGNRVSGRVGRELSEGVLHLLAVIGLVAEDLLPFPWAAMTRPLTVGDEEVHRVRTDRSGLFLPEVEIWQVVEAGDLLGRVIDPVTGAVREDIASPATGHVLALREQPVVYLGSMVARVVAT